MNIKKRIEKNRNTGEKIKYLILKEKNIEEKIRLLEFLASFYSKNITGIYYSEFIESELKRISEKVELYDDNTLEEKESTLHILTCAYNIGGHTRVVDNWIRFDKMRKHNVLINVPEESDIPEWLKESIAESGGDLILNESKNIIEKAKFLRRYAKKYEKIILHTHNEDLIPSIAFLNEKWTKKIYLYNHSDHKFWVGVNIADTVLELSTKGKLMSNERRGIDNNFVLSIPIKSIEESQQIGRLEKEEIKKKLHIPEKSKVVLSIASDYKFNCIEGYNFIEFSEKVVKLDKNIYFLIVGADPTSKRWKDISKKTKGRVIAIGLIDKKLLSEYIKIADIYVDSFPLNSYTCCLEAIGASLYTLSLQTPLSDLDSLKEIKYNSEEEMLERIKEFIKVGDKISFTCGDVRLQIEKDNYELGWFMNLENIFSEKNIKLTKDIKKIENINNDKYVIYDEFLYRLNIKEYKFPIRKFNKLLAVNKIKLLSIFSTNMNILIEGLNKEVKRKVRRRCIIFQK